MKVFYIFLFVAFPAIIFAQANYHAGYILKNNGDTLKGYIDYREWQQSPTAIDFKLNKADKEPQSFNPETIKGFDITGMENYTSYAGNITMNKNHFPDLAEGPDTTTLYSLIFIKKLTTGSHITLFFENDSKKARFFIGEGHEKPIELRYYQYYSDKGEAVDHPVYRGQLILLINKFNNGNPALVAEAGQMHYEQSEFEDMVDKINQNVTSLRIDSVSTRTRKANSRWFFGGGGVFTTTTLSGVSISNSFSPELHIGLDFFINRNVQQVILRAEVSGYNISASYQYSSLQDPATISTASYGQFTIAFTPQIIINVFNTDKLKIYIDGGVNVNLSSYSDGNPDAGAYGNPWFGVRGQAGVVFNKKLEFSISYSPYAGYAGSVFKNQSEGIGFRYLLNNN